MHECQKCGAEATCHVTERLASGSFATLHYCKDCCLEATPAWCLRPALPPSPEELASLLAESFSVSEGDARRIAQATVDEWERRNPG